MKIKNGVVFFINCSCQKHSMNEFYFIFSRKMVYYKEYQCEKKANKRVVEKTTSKNHKIYHNLAFEKNKPVLSNIYLFFK